ncbi:MAG: hypothetical protein CL608_14410 [Anaerolineaceae bacterium]|nr:hypothetical protein [Anaerolineaceae bacterium]
MSETQLNGNQDREGVLLAYAELCRSYNAIRAFRARLLSLLPLTSSGGIFLLLNNEISAVSPITIMTLGILGCLVTAGLYIYERHNMERCHRLIHIGAKWEEQKLNLDNGQFMMRVNGDEAGIVSGSRYKLAAGLIYGAVFLGWCYLIVAGLLRIFCGVGLACFAFL